MKFMFCDLSDTIFYWCIHKVSRMYVLENKWKKLPNPLKTFYTTS